MRDLESFRQVKDVILKRNNKPNSEFRYDFTIACSEGGKSCMEK